MPAVGLGYSFTRSTWPLCPSCPHLVLGCPVLNAICKQARAYLGTRHHQTHVRVLCQVTTAVEFSRIWWDKRAKHPSITRVSFWRPNPPPGYAALGDCMVTGMYAPPQEVWVIRDAEPGQEEEETTPLLKKPINYNLVSAQHGAPGVVRPILAGVMLACVSHLTLTPPVVVCQPPCAFAFSSTSPPCHLLLEYSV